MIDSTTVSEANLEHAERMVRTGSNTPEQAARICGVALTDLQARLTREPKPETIPPSWRRFLS